MNKSLVLALATLTATIGCAEETATPTPIPAALTNIPAAAATNAPATISVQEMLVSGPSHLKLHSLAMISQGNIPGEVDESFLPGFKVCAEDATVPLRSIAAQQIGKNFIQGNESPNLEAVALLIQLSKDESEDVRYNSVYYGLSQMSKKSDEILNRLIDVAATDRQSSLYDRIAESLEGDRERVAKILDQKLKEGNDIALYEIYKDLTGSQPPHEERYLDMPSSRPRLIIFTSEGSDPIAEKLALEKALKEAGIQNPNILIADEQKKNYLLIIKTYITRDRLVIEKAFENHPRFTITYNLWLTPDQEAWLESTQSK